jgi:ATP-dependent DNA helicase RecG
VLLYQGPLSQNGRHRLETLRSSNDGFYIAEQDLALRGPGELLGTRQTGMAQYRIADIERDEDLLPYVENSAQQLLASAPQHVTPLIERWLGEAPKYANA